MDKEVVEILRPLSRTLEAVGRPLNVLALMVLAKEFYPAEERARLYKHFAELQEVDQAAFEVLSNAALADNMGWEERVKKYGEVAAKEQVAPHLNALDKRKDTLAALSKFRSEHGLIVKLVEYRLQLEKQ